ncbi:MAG: hypothetical protein GY810_06650 [Aureispira sp.]|nr:hypothetical protein [Aureispira sp.]
MSRLKIIYIFSFIVGLTFSIQSCQKDSKTKSYANDVAPIINNYCTTCHSGMAASAGIDLTSYQSVKHQTEQGNLLNRINDANTPMPPSGIIPKEERQIITDWSKISFPE